MTDAIRELYDKASALPADERAELARLLLDTLHDPADDVEEAWSREIEQRMSDYRAGRVTTLSWEEVRAHLHRSDR